MRLATLNPRSAYARPPVLVGQARKLVFNSLTPLFVYDKFSMKKTWVTLCQFSYTQGICNGPR
jgi:hypothetical protein